MTAETATGGGASSQLFSDVSLASSDSASEQTSEGAGIAAEGAESAMEAPQAEGESQPEATPQDPYAEKFKGKSPEEIIKAYAEAEKLMHAKTQEAAELRKQMDTYNEFAKAMSQQQKGETQSQAQVKQQPKYFHEADPETMQRTYEAIKQRYSEDPLELAANLYLNQPYYIDQHLQKSDVVKNMVARQVADYVNYYNSWASQYDSFVKDFAQKNPDFETYKDDVQRTVQYLAQTGMLGQFQGQNINPLEFALNYVRGSKQPQQQKAIEAAMKQKMAAEQANQMSGFQLTGAAEPKISSNTPDPLGLYRKGNKEPNIFGV